jgi:hypothetical protein
MLLRSGKILNYNKIPSELSLFFKDKKCKKDLNFVFNHYPRILISFNDTNKNYSTVSNKLDCTTAIKYFLTIINEEKMYTRRILLFVILSYLLNTKLYLGLRSVYSELDNIILKKIKEVKEDSNPKVFHIIKFLN